MSDEMRNIAMCSGFAWKTAQGEWLLQQRAPLLMGLPIRFGAGVREPEQGEPIDIIGHVVGEGGLHVVADYLSRANAETFPKRINWAVSGISTRGVDGVKHVIDSFSEVGSNAVAAGVLEMLLPTAPAMPDAIKLRLSGDDMLESWAARAEPESRSLENRVMVTGYVEDIRRRENVAAEHPSHRLSYDIDLRVGRGDVIPCRLTHTVPNHGAIAAMLRKRRGEAVTLVGSLRTKVFTDTTTGETRSIHHIRLTDALAPTNSDLSGELPVRVPGKGDAGNP